MIRNGTLSEIPNGCELGVSDDFFLENFQLDPNSEMWKEFWSEIPDVT